MGVPNIPEFFIVDTDIIRDVLDKDERVVFAYLYGSVIEEDRYRDIDIAVYSKSGYDPFVLSADLKVELYEFTGISPDIFDVRVINDLLINGDIFSLIYLKNVFEKNELLVDKDFDLRADFLERYGMKYRECEGLIKEVVS